MDKLKQWIALTLVGALGILAVGWFVLVSPKRGEAAELRTQALTQRSANAALETQIEMLKAQAAELPKEQATLAEVAAKIPDNTALPGLVRALIDASTESGVQLVSITPGPPTPVAAPVTAAAAPVVSQTTPDAAVTPPVTAPAATGGLASIPVALNVVGDYFEIAQFLVELESLSRALRVNDLAVTPGASPTEPDADPAAVEDGSILTATVNGFVFMAAGGTAASPPVPGSAVAPATVPAPAN